MNLKKVRYRTSEYNITSSLEARGAFTTEDIDGNIFGLAEDIEKNITYFCAYGSATLTFYDFEINNLKNSLSIIAKKYNDIPQNCNTYIKSFKPIYEYKRQFNFDVIEVKKYEDMDLYVIKQRGEYKYYLEKGKVRLGGTISDWRHSINDWIDLLECFKEWKRNMRNVVDAAK